MRRALRPATFVLAAVLVSLAACSSSPTAPSSVKQPTAATHDDTPVDTTARSGIVLPHG
jgi:hypothetical protein